MATKTIKHWDLERGSQDLGYDEYNVPRGSSLLGVNYNGTNYIIDEDEEKLENSGRAITENLNATLREELRDIAPERIWQVTNYNSQKEIATVKEVKDSKLVLDVLVALIEKQSKRFEMRPREVIDSFLFGYSL
jgi:hypothetical protein